MARTFQRDDEERLRQLHRDGLSRNEIARQTGWSVGTITNHSSRLGLSYDREAVRAAGDARQIDLRDRRQRIEEQLYDLAELNIQRARGEYLMTGFDHTGILVTELVPEPPAKETKDLTQAASTALTTAVRLAQVDAGDSGRENAQGLLRGLGDAMTAAADALAQDMGIGDAAEYGG